MNTATAVLHTLLLLKTAPPTVSNSYSDTKVYLYFASSSILVSGLNKSGRERKVGIYCKVRTIKGGNRKEEPCHTATVNLKCQVGVEITARGFKSVVALTVTSQRQVTILAISQVPELNWLRKQVGD